MVYWLKPASPAIFLTTSDFFSPATRGLVCGKELVSHGVQAS